MATRNRGGASSPDTDEERDPARLGGGWTPSELEAFLAGAIAESTDDTIAAKEREQAAKRVAALQSSIAAMREAGVTDDLVEGEREQRYKGGTASRRAVLPPVTPAPVERKARGTLPDAAELASAYEQADRDLDAYDKARAQSEQRTRHLRAIAGVLSVAGVYGESESGKRWARRARSQLAEQAALAAMPTRRAILPEERTQPNEYWRVDSRFAKDAYRAVQPNETRDARAVRILEWRGFAWFAAVRAITGLACYSAKRSALYRAVDRVRKKARKDSDALAAARFAPFEPMPPDEAVAWLRACPALRDKRVPPLPRAEPWRHCGTFSRLEMK